MCADPERFAGDPKDTDRLLNSVTNIFTAQLTAYPYAEHQIRFALSFLKGNAAKWGDNLCRDLREGRFAFTTWNAFEDRFRETFGNPYAKKDAQRKLMGNAQGNGALRSSLSSSTTCDMKPTWAKRPPSMLSAKLSAPGWVTQRQDAILSL